MGTGTGLGVYPLSPLTLLKALDGVSLPPSFRTVVVVDEEGKWVEKAFKKKGVAEFAAKGFAVEVEEEEDEYGRWTKRTVFISMENECEEVEGAHSVQKEKEEKKGRCL